ncbi:zinc-ribbon domain-containing protein [Oryzibacter oryziterrae]|uniref:zinc-ribbon domain-containing protein n=1 Tax=Oryzibacter oryziterrae TaxID=2766474 RepID=UPI001F3CB640|nr:zinc-ribbon domain-containing protein [Oryzibacter oryziterrae]
MRIVCPSCEASYQLADGALGSTGRKVRCARCGNVWHAFPAEQPPPPEPDAWASAFESAPQPEPSDDEWKEAIAGDQQPTRKSDPFDDIDVDAEPDAAASEPDPLPPVPSAPVPVAPAVFGNAAGDTDEAAGPDGPTIEPTPAGFEPEKRIKLGARKKKSSTRQRSAAAVWAIDKHLSTPVAGALLLGFLMMLVVTALFARVSIVRAFPDFAGLYASVGLEVNLRGMRFDSVQTHRESDGATPVLVIDGNIQNLTVDTQKLPALRITLKSATGRDVYAWNYALPQTTIDPDATLHFKTRLMAPPDAATMAEVRFTDDRAP